MFKNPFSFKGRIGRVEYGITLAVVYVAATALGMLVQKSTVSSAIFALMLPLSWLLLAQGAKRCHDISVSGWYQIIPLYPFVLIAAPGHAVENKYGLSRKEAHSK